jgi:hypothetical protein
VAERIGVPQPTLNVAKQHVAAVERYPVLEGRGIPQKHAITIAKNLDKLPVKDRNEAIEKLQKCDPTTTTKLAEVAALPPRPAPTAGEKWLKTLYEISKHLTSVLSAGGVRALVASWSAQQRRAYAQQVDYFITELSKIKRELAAPKEKRK